MLQPPPIKDAGYYPIVTGTALFSIAATLIWWTDIDMTPLMMSEAISRGEVWRLFTSALLHGGVIHLAFNLLWLWVLGTIVERAFGQWKTAAIFVFLAGVSSAAEFALMRGGVGLSGVVYGLFGMLWVLSRRDRRFAGAIDQQTIGLFVAWFFICIVTTYFGLMNIGNVAHGSGAVFGALLGAAISSRGNTRTAAAVVTGVLAVACLVGATVARPYVNLQARSTAQQQQQPAQIQSQD